MKFIKRLRTSNSNNIWKTFDPDDQVGASTNPEDPVYKATVTKIITFAIELITTDAPLNPMISFPFNGVLKGVQASYSILGQGGNSTRIKLQKASKISVETGSPIWNDVLSDMLVIPVGTYTSTTQPNIIISAVTSGDFFRVCSVEHEIGARGLVVEVAVEVT